MNGGKIFEHIEMDLRQCPGDHTVTVHIDVMDNSLSHKWCQALLDIIDTNCHLEKNYCFLGWPESDRGLHYLTQSINSSIAAINAADLGYHIQDFFSPENTIDPDGRLVHHKLNQLHRYFEDLQGTSHQLSQYYMRACPTVRWHIRQLNLLCHEYESLVLSLRKKRTAFEWMRPSQLLCWLNAPRFALEPADHELFGTHTISRSLGGVFVGVNKAVGKHHWEVFNDEGRDSRLHELTTTTLSSQTEAAGDFDIEWANDPSGQPWQEQRIAEFRQWLRVNDFDPDDPSLTIGHPKVGQVDLMRSFGTLDYRKIWQEIAQHLDVYKIRMAGREATYDYHWGDAGFQQRQIELLRG